MTSSLVEVAIAILHQEDRFLMQLRDNNPGILYPGHWAFFGGHLEVGESPQACVQRELLEEIGYAPQGLTLFQRYEFPTVIRHVFVGQLDVSLDRLVLGEGWDLGLLSPEDIQHGQAFSSRAGQVRPIGEPHQKILLDFIAQGTQLA